MVRLILELMIPQLLSLVRGKIKVFDDSGKQEARTPMQVPCRTTTLSNTSTVTHENFFLWQSRA